LVDPTITLARKNRWTTPELLIDLGSPVTNTSLAAPLLPHMKTQPA